MRIYASIDILWTPTPYSFHLEERRRRNEEAFRVFAQRAAHEAKEKELQAEELVKQLRLKEHQPISTPNLPAWNTPPNWVGPRCFQPMTLRWVGMQDQEAAEKAKAAELERRKLQELRLARHRKLQKEADVAAKRRCGRGGMSWGGELNRILIRRDFGVLQITLAHLWIEDEWSWLSQHSIKLDAPGARTCAPPLPSAPPCWTPRQLPRRPHRGALPRRPARGTWMAQQWQGNKAPGMVGHMTYDRFVRGEFFLPLCVTMMCHLIFFFFKSHCHCTNNQEYLWRTCEWWMSCVQKGLRLFAESLDSAHGYYSCKSRPKSAAGRDGLCIAWMWISTWSGKMTWNAKAL